MKLTEANLAFVCVAANPNSKKRMCKTVGVGDLSLSGF